MSTSGDLRFAIRTFRRDPLFTGLILFILALGIGANTAVFSLVNAVLLRPLPYHQPERLVLFFERLPQLPMDFIPVSQGGFLDWRERSRVFEDMAIFENQDLTLTGQGEARQLKSLRVSANLLSVLGASPQLGRGFHPGEDQAGKDAVVLLSYSLWQSSFAGDRGVLGRTIILDDRPSVVVGVTPPEFFFPPPIDILGAVHSMQADIYVPYVLDPSERGNRGNLVVARLGDEVTRARALEQLNGVAQSLIADFPSSNPPGMEPVLKPIHDQAVSRSRQGLLVLMGAVGLILLIACFNVANLMLVRAAGRSREVALRTALGAGSRRILGQMLTESFLLTLAAAAAGIGVAWLGVRLILWIASEHIPLSETVSIDMTVLLFAVAVAVATGLVFGLAPARQVWRLNLADTLKAGARGDTSASGGQLFRSAIVAVEVALAVVLLIGSGLFIQSFRQLQRVDLGFRPGNAFSLPMPLPPDYEERPKNVEFFARMRERIESIPGVQKVGAVSQLPLSGSRSASGMGVRGQPVGDNPQDRQLRIVDRRIVLGDYFEAMGIPLLEGRFFDLQDQPDGGLVFIANQTLARRFWPEGSAIGAEVTLEGENNAQARWGRIVGVVGNVKHSGLEMESQAALYLPQTQYGSRQMIMVVKSNLMVDRLSGALRQQIAALDPRLPVEIQSLESIIDQAQSSRRAPMVLLVSFAVLALVLAFGGLYGVLSYLVRRRRAEIGVRMALGARPGDIGAMVIRQTTLLATVGLVLGLASAWAMSRLLEGLLFQVSPTDWTVYLGAVPLFALTVALASFVPARRAAAIDPVRALRQE